MYWIGFPLILLACPQILRCYDTRFRPTHRSPRVYLDKRCEGIVGGKVTKVTSLTDDVLDLYKSEGWISKERELLVIAVPYKNGSHIVTKLTDFIPIIEQLQELHKIGYVHGDIRGFNVLFSENGEGGLIDFDFSGTPDNTYPDGYRQALNDGFRKGDGNAESEDNRLAFSHDWYALGQLMFSVHDIEVPSNSTMDADELLLSRTGQYWKKISGPPIETKIGELIKTLEHLNQAKFTVEPKPKFREEANVSHVPNVTKEGATGSPPPANKK